MAEAVTITWVDVAPARTPVATPDELIVATDSLLLSHEKITSLMTSPSDVFAVAVNRCVPPSSMDAIDGLTSMLSTTSGGGSVTVSIADPVLPPSLALMVVVPALTPLARPEELTVAADGLLLDQLNETFWIATL